MKAMIENTQEDDNQEKLNTLFNVMMSIRSNGSPMLSKDPENCQESVQMIEACG